MKRNNYPYVNNLQCIKLLGVDYLFFFLSSLISSKPIAIQISSRIRTSRATKIPALSESPKPFTDIRKPPSRPPNCRGMKKSILAKREVKARMRIQSK